MSNPQAKGKQPPAQTGRRAPPKTVPTVREQGIAPSSGALGPIPPTPPGQLFSMAALRRAWLAVKRTGGGAGADGMTIQKFEADLTQQLNALREELMSGNYQPRSLRRVMVPKANGGLRPLTIWVLPDRIAQRVIYDLIAPTFEAHFLDCSVGFRPGLGVQDAITMIQQLRDQNLHWVVDADIKDCFDSIDPQRLLPLLAAQVHDALVLRYIERWLAAKIFNSADGVPTAAGAAQGSVLSPLLANIYLHEVDQLLVAQGLHLIRYADDLVVCCQRKSEAQHALVAVHDALRQWGLTLNDRKTRLVHFTEGFEWLGHFFIRRECYRL